MNFIVAEDPNNAITDLLSEVRSRYPNSSTYRVHKENYDQAIKAIQRPPMLTNGWLTIVTPDKLSPNQIKRIGSVEQNLNIFHVIQSSDLEPAKELLDKAELEYRSIDNLHPSKEIILEYIMRELNADKDLAGYIAKRGNYYIPRIYESVLLLGIVEEELSRKVVSKYTTSYGTASITTLVEYIIGYDSSVSIKSILSLVDNYRHGIHFLFKTIKEELGNILTGYKLIISGQLTLKNYTTFKSEGFKLSTWKLKRILNYFQELSYEKIYLISVSICREEREDVPTLLKYIQGGGI